MSVGILYTFSKSVLDKVWSGFEAFRRYKRCRNSLHFLQVLLISPEIRREFNFFGLSRGK